MVRLLTGTVLSPASLILLNDWLVASETGRKRIRHGLPSEWRVGDKTGTGNNSAVNDVAIVWPPQRSPVVITVYMSDSPHPIAELEQIHAHVGALLR
jgi:beta-lactamase class A